MSMNLDTLLYLVPRMMNDIVSDKEAEVEKLGKALIYDTTVYVHDKVLGNSTEESLDDLVHSYKLYQQSLQELDRLKKAVAEYDTTALTEEIKQALN